MLEHLPAWLGGLLQNVRAGHDKLVIAHLDVATPAGRIDLSSPAFADGGRLPERFTADGAGMSPPLLWGQLPAATASLALIVEDPDALSFQPLVHAIVWHVSPGEHGIDEGAIAADRSDKSRDVGRNSCLTQGWLPPDPPTGHGRHDYVFQLFALSDALSVDNTPGRTAFVEAIAGKVLGAGMLIGTYSRDEPSHPLANAEALNNNGIGTAAPA